MGKKQKKPHSTLKYISQTIMSDGSVIVNATYKNYDGYEYTRTMPCKNRNDADSYIEYIVNMNNFIHGIS